MRKLQIFCFESVCVCGETWLNNRWYRVLALNAVFKTHIIRIFLIQFLLYRIDFKDLDENWIKWWSIHPEIIISISKQSSALFWDDDKAFCMKLLLY